MAPSKRLRDRLSDCRLVRAPSHVGSDCWMRLLGSIRATRLVRVERELGRGSVICSKDNSRASRATKLEMEEGRGPDRPMGLAHPL